MEISISNFTHSVKPINTFLSNFTFELLKKIVQLWLIMKGKYQMY